MASPAKSQKWYSKIISPRSISDSQSAEEPDKDSKSRRREQVRRAQRTHRDRKAIYVKSLELEVAKLRARDVAYEAQVQLQKETIRRLADFIHAHNLELPTDLPTIPSQSPQAMIEVVGPPNETQRIRAHMPTFDAQAPHPFQRPSSPPQGSRDPPYPSVTNGSLSEPSHAFSTNLPTSLEQLNIGTSASASNPYGLDSSQVGIDFVLTLERPCLYHYRLPNPQVSDDSEGNFGAGHEQMLLAPIMARAPQFKATSSTQSNLADGSRWSVPAIELEKLLAFSESLTLDGEITPIQAWQRIRKHPGFAQLTQSGLETLAQSLLTVIKCYGFGAVVDEAYFERMLQQTFNFQ